MIRTQRALADRKRAHVKRLGIRGAPFALIEVGEIVERARDVGMVAPEQLLPDRK